MSVNFLITEVATVDGGAVVDLAELFVWDEANQAMPEDGWATPGLMRMVPTHYTGNQRPTFQILGAKLEKQTFKGLWADRHMGAGQSSGTCDRFWAMWKRGNLVRVEHQGFAVHGYIEGFTPTRVFEGEIRYEFTMVPAFERPGTEISGGTRKASAYSLKSPAELEADALGIVTDMDALHAAAPDYAWAGGYYQDAGQRLGVVTIRIGEVRRLTQIRASSPIDPIAASLQLATAYGSLRVSCLDLLDVLEPLDDDTVVAWDSPENYLGFEVWCRLLRDAALMLSYQSYTAEAELRAQTRTRHVRTHRCTAGQSIYYIGKLYGVDWRDIVARNGLESPDFDGTEVLVIGEASA